MVTIHRLDHYIALMKGVLCLQGYSYQTALGWWSRASRSFHRGYHPVTGCRHTSLRSSLHQSRSARTARQWIKHTFTVTSVVKSDGFFSFFNGRAYCFMAFTSSGLGLTMESEVCSSFVPGTLSAVQSERCQSCWVACPHRSSTCKGSRRCACAGCSDYSLQPCVWMPTFIFLVFPTLFYVRGPL